jgi:hypothetical protein
MRYVEAFYTREIGLVDFACDRYRYLFVAGAFCSILVNEKKF